MVRLGLEASAFGKGSFDLIVEQGQVVVDGFSKHFKINLEIPMCQGIAHLIG